MRFCCVSQTSQTATSFRFLVVMKHIRGVAIGFSLKLCKYRMILRIGRCSQLSRPLQTAEVHRRHRVAAQNAASGRGKSRRALSLITFLHCPLTLLLTLYTNTHSDRNKNALAQAPWRLPRACVVSWRRRIFEFIGVLDRVVDFIFRSAPAQSVVLFQSTSLSLSLSLSLSFLKFLPTNNI